MDESTVELTLLEAHQGIDPGGGWRLTIDDELRLGLRSTMGTAVRQRSAIDARKDGGPLEDGSDKRSDLALRPDTCSSAVRVARNDSVRSQPEGNVFQVHDGADSESGHDHSSTNRNLGHHRALGPGVTKPSGESRTVSENLVSDVLDTLHAGSSANKT